MGELGSFQASARQKTHRTPSFGRRETHITWHLEHFGIHWKSNTMRIFLEMIWYLILDRHPFYLLCWTRPDNGQQYMDANKPLAEVQAGHAPQQSNRSESNSRSNVWQSSWPNYHMFQPKKWTLYTTRAHAIESQSERQPNLHMKSMLDIHKYA